MSSTTDVPQKELIDANMNCSQNVSFGEVPSAPLSPYIESTEVVTQLLKTSYGFNVIQLKPQNGYDDLNYHVLVAPDHSNPYVGEVPRVGYFMKISNLRDSANPEYLNAQLAVMEHLLKKGIQCQSPIRSISGKTLTECTTANKDGKMVFLLRKGQCTTANKDGTLVTYVVSLRTFLPGTVIADVPLTPKLLYNLGQFVAKLTHSLEDFKHPFYETFQGHWSMNVIPGLRKLLFAVQDDKRRRISAEVIQSFIADVEPSKPRFRTGQVHGDVNEQNILVTAESSPDSVPEICGLIDFQDSQMNFPIYDLAMCVAYMLMAKTLEVPVLDTPGHILAGYSSVLDLSQAESAVFKTLISARIVQSLVMGAYTYSLDPTNQYVLTTAQCGWKSLETLWESDNEQTRQRWHEIVKSYQ